MEKTQPQSVDEARQQAIEWQMWMADQDMSYGELADWQGHFTETGEKFGLTEEFKENGII
jgi:hypothetical protein